MSSGGAGGGGGGGGPSIPIFQPKEDLMATLTDMGITRNAAMKGLYYTGNYNADLAAAWVFDNGDEADTPFNPEEDEECEEAAGMQGFLEEGDFYKMVFIVNSELGMGVGKVGAQVGHATLGLYKVLLADQARYGEGLLQWEQFGETKIVLKGTNMGHLLELAAKATTLQLANYVVQDAGRTQIAAGSITVLGIMGKTDVVDQVTGTLDLL